MSDTESPLPEKSVRSIRSFVLRQGRATESQKRAFEVHWPSLGLDYSGQPVDFSTVFPKPADLVVEIGFGNGEQLLFGALHEPERNFIGIEVHSPGVGRALNAVAEAGLGNVRIYRHDAVEVLRDDIADGSLTEVRIYFPDPWHKKRHHKRRLIQADFIALLCLKLKPGGLLHLASDWQEYVEHMWEVCDNEPELLAKGGPRHSVERPDWRRQTHFETRGLKLGHGVWDLFYTRR
ncbi:MAG: tRNA (guanosine(46)-N7)-methyltransferase TrmB [Gammaproteobacteria bacterium]|jgi:tRNA (guanine-N7-)-methyltransferase|nr:tRNA (guanosine(46)-N7)-methyltransferase TrmB [Xanthomonadaceae bacterium]